MAIPVEQIQALVVEDDPGLAETIRFLLECKGHSAEFANNQHEARFLIGSCEYAYVLLDLQIPADDTDMLPHVDVGLDLLKEIRREFEPGDLPVLVMTAFGADAQTAVQAMKLGANDYICKPFSDSDEAFDDKLAGLLAIHDRPRRNPAKDERHILGFNGDEATVDGIRVESQKAVEVLRILVGRRLAAQEAGMKGSELANRLKVSESALRRTLVRFRKEIARTHRTAGLPPPDPNAVVESGSWRGYRINTQTCEVRLPGAEPDE